MKTMGSRSSAKEILKQYANAERKARIEYIDNISGRAEHDVCRNYQNQHSGVMSLKRNLRLAILIGILLTVAATTVIGVANDGGINVQGLDIREGAGELIISYEDGYGPEDGDNVVPLEPGYIPEGYKPEYRDEDTLFRDCYMGYVDAGQEDILIEQNYKADVKLGISTFLAEIETTELSGYDACKVIGYDRTVYIVYKDKVNITVYGELSDSEAGKIIESME